MDRSKYPPDWAAISAAVRARANGRCECAGECGHDHRHDFGAEFGAISDDRCSAWHGGPNPVTRSGVVLTAAHLWRGPCAEHHAAGVKCGELEHLAAMCQRCHLAYDREHHVANARRKRRSRKASGDLFE